MMYPFRVPERAERNWQAIRSETPAELVSGLLDLLERLLPKQADPDMALNNLERFVVQPASKRHMPALIQKEGRGLEVLLQLFSSSQFFSDLLVRQPDDVEIVLQPLRRSPSVEELIQELQALIASTSEDTGILRMFRRFRQRHHLRIGVNDIIHNRLLEEITSDLSNIAEASLEVAYQVAFKNLSNRFGVPHTAQGQPARCAILAFGKLGGGELNYSSDIDLLFVYDEEGTTQGKRASQSNDEFYSRLVTEVIRLLSVHTDQGQAYRIDLRLRPEGDRGPVTRSLDSTLSYYDTLGRTWERQALIKLRPIAGDQELGKELLHSLEPFVYRKYLSFAEINEIKAMKRRIEQKAHKGGDSEREVKTGPGGIRDIEFTIQFLQLLNGGDLPRLRLRNTLAAMLALENAGCLTDPEYRVLEDGYRFLRKVEHRLQLMCDLQTHRLPDRTEELEKLALRMGYVEKQPSEEIEEEPATPRNPTLAPQRLSPLDEPTIPQLDTRQLLIDPLEQFLHDYHEKTRLNRTILDHLLHQTFADSDEQAEPETDLILAPDPDEITLRSVLGRYPFRDVPRAYQNLMQLAQEAGPFLSTLRCRHFLASIAPQLLRAVAETPDPDLALLNLEQVTASLGAKAVLWELFSFNPPILRLYVDLCSNSSFLSQILINNPGMIDDLLDSLILNRPRTREDLQEELQELGRGVEKAEIMDPILHSFQDKEQLRIGVRDLLGKDDVQDTTAALSDLAETILVEVVARQETTMAVRFGMPILTDGPRAGDQSRFVVLALGKLGGREMSYHSDLDLIFIYEGDGRTAPLPSEDPLNSHLLTDNSHYFTELTQRIIRTMSHMGPMGKLYPIDMRLRPTGQSGNLVIPLHEFCRYYAEGGGMIWERQSLTRARVVYGDSDFGQTVMASVQHAIYGTQWKPEIVDEIRNMRYRLESNCSPRSLKRSPGGMMDIEFLVQMFRMKYGRNHPVLECTNTWESLDALLRTSFLNKTEHAILHDSYSFHRLAESRLRIVTNRTLNEYPEAEEDLEKLARRMGFTPDSLSAAQQFREELRLLANKTRELFDQILERER